MAAGYRCSEVRKASRKQCPKVSLAVNPSLHSSPEPEVQNPPGKRRPERCWSSIYRPGRRLAIDEEYMYFWQRNAGLNGSSKLFRGDQLAAERHAGEVFPAVGRFLAYEGQFSDQDTVVAITL